MEKDTQFKLVAICFILAVLLLGYFMLKLIDENKACIENPFTYSASQINVLGSDSKALCSCSGGTDSFYFDEDGMYKENPIYFTPILNLKRKI